MIVALSIMILGVILLIVPNIYFMKQIEKESLALQQVQNQLLLLNAKFQSLVIWGNDMSEVSGQLYLLDDFFADPTNLLSLVQSFEKLADAGQVEMVISSLSAGSSKQGPRDVVARLVVAGSFEECMRFLYRLENMRYLSEVQEVTISGSEIDGAVEMNTRVKLIAHED